MDLPNQELPQACNFIEKETLASVFPVNFAKSLRTPFYLSTSGRLLLKLSPSLLVTYSVIELKITGE